MFRGLFGQLDWLTNKVKKLCCIVEGLIYLKINLQTSNYTLVESDKNKLIDMRSINPLTLTVPNSSNVSFPIGTQIMIIRSGIGAVTVVPEPGVTIDSVSGWTKLANRYSGATLIKYDTNSWYLIGDLSI